MVNLHKAFVVKDRCVSSNRNGCVKAALPMEPLPIYLFTNRLLLVAVKNPSVRNADEPLRHMTSTSPVQPKDRTVVVDVIRGFALTGVLLANFNSFTEQQTPGPILHSISSSLDQILMRFNAVFLEWKFMTLFSILFGYGFGLILESLERKNIHPDFFFMKRMFWLFVFGAIHCLFWWGDVLNLYAMSGILLLLFRKRSNNFILTCGVLFTFFLPIWINYLLRHLPETFTEADIQGLYTQYKQGSLRDVFAFNIRFYYRMFIVSGANLHDISETLGRFLLGYYLLRIQLFDSVETKHTTFRKAALLSAPIMLTYFIFRWSLLQGTVHVNPYLQSWLLSVGIVSTTTFYVSVLVLCHISFGMNPFFSSLQALGRMTLTNYLAVSAFLIVLLYGFGFNQLGELPIHSTWLLAITWLLIEILISRYWLKRFRYGPVEWIWRQLTYWKKLPLRQ